MNGARPDNSSLLRAAFFMWVAPALILAGCVTILYWPVMFAAPGSVPWGSDTLGHVLKAEYLQRAIQGGNFYPNILPAWYMGLQMLRYHPPLPYYLLVLIAAFSGNMISAAGWFVALAAFAGGVNCMLFQRWLGWLPALLVGVLFLFLPDNVRVAMAEGNLPRVLATALLPLAVYFLFRLLESPTNISMAWGLAISFTLILLAHVMMAAIYAACCAVMVLLAMLFRKKGLRVSLLAILVIGVGIGLAGAWLLPSLVGGLTGLDSSAVTEALGTMPASLYLNPYTRSNPEAFYVGLGLIAFAMIALFARRYRDPISTGLIVTAFLGIVITVPGPNELYNSLPMHGLMWPLRFLGLASFFLLLGLFWIARKIRLPLQTPVLALFVLLALDGSLSLHLIHTRPAREDVVTVGGMLSELPGWREATLDDSRLSSEPSYFLTKESGREQLFGWAYQGARTARNVAALNEAAQFDHPAYLVDRLALYGTDDILLLNTMAVSDTILPALESAGYQRQFTGAETALFHQDGSPRAALYHWRVLGIGRGAQNLAYVFPQVILGSSFQVDDYSPAFLNRFDVIFLSGFNWHDMSAAEELLKNLAQSGKEIVIDLTGTPDDPLARIPHFLDVWGEPVLIGSDAIQLGQTSLGPFGSADEQWHAIVPQGLEKPVLEFNYLGQTATALGYSDKGKGRVWFVGLNLVYYSALHPGTPADKILADVIGLPVGQAADYRFLPLEDYSATQDGYSFRYHLDESSFALLPFAAHDGYQVKIDGHAVDTITLDNLIGLDLQQGDHLVSIGFPTTSVHILGWVVSVISLIAGGLLTFWLVRKGNDFFSVGKVSL